MTTSNIIQQFFRQFHHPKTKITSFKPGQIFFGKVTKLFPNQTAEVQVGNQKLVAHLETPLVADKRYWFQVQPGDGKLHLKVLTTANDNNLNRLPGEPDEILARLSLPQSKEMLLLVKFFMKEQLPLTREMLLVAAEWLKQSANITSNLQTIKQVISEQLPFTQSVLSAFNAMTDQSSLSELMSNLQQLLLKDETKTDYATKLLTNLTNLTNSNKQSAIDVSVRTIIEKWLFGTNEEQKSSFKLMQTIGIFPKDSNEQTIFKKLFQTLPLQTDNPLLTNNKIRNQIQLLRQLSTSIRMNDEQETNLLISKIYQNKNDQSRLVNSNIISEKLIDRVIRTILQTVLTEINNNENTPQRQLQMAQNNEQLYSLLTNNAQQYNQLKLILEGLIDNKINFKDTSGNINQKTILSPEEQTVLQSIKQQIEQLVPKWENNDFVLRAMENIMKSLGLNFENDIHTNKINSVEEMLKPLLIKYIEEQPLTNSRIAAEQLLHRLTGMQLFSQETGPLQQILVQLPIKLWSRTVDLTMQWSGRKTEEGNIDPNFCRVLFYLQLENINETVIDLQVQNRIMNLTIFNDRNDLQNIAKPMLQQLKNKIEESYYKLSVVSFKQFSEKEKDNIHPIPVHYDRHYTGVDIRI